MEKKIRINDENNDARQRQFFEYLQEFKETGHKVFVRHCTGLLPASLLIFLLVMHVNGGIKNLAVFSKRLGFSYSHMYNIKKLGKKLGLVKYERIGKVTLTQLTNDGRICIQDLLEK